MSTCSSSSELPRPATATCSPENAAFRGEKPAEPHMKMNFEEKDETTASYGRLKGKGAMSVSDETLTAHDFVNRKVPLDVRGEEITFHRSLLPDQIRGAAKLVIRT